MYLIHIIHWKALRHPLWSRLQVLPWLPGIQVATSHRETPAMQRVSGHMKCSDGWHCNNKNTITHVWCTFHREATARDQRYVKCYLRAGAAALQLGRITEAIEAYQQAVALAPGNRTAKASPSPISNVRGSFHITLLITPEGPSTSSCNSAGASAWHLMTWLSHSS